MSLQIRKGSSASQPCSTSCIVSCHATSSTSCHSVDSSEVTTAMFRTLAIPVFQLCTVCLLLNCHFCLLHGLALLLILRSHFWYRQTIQNGTVKVLSFVLLLSCACGTKMGPPGGSIFGTVFRFIFEVFCIKVAEAQCFGSMKLCGLWRPERQTREALLSEAGFEKVFRTQNWVRRSKLFCR